MSQIWGSRRRWDEESGLRACYGKSPGNGAFSIDPFVGVATALGRMDQAGDALTVLAINIAALLVAATATVAVQRRFLD